MKAPHGLLLPLLLSCACSPVPWTQESASYFPQSPHFEVGINVHLDPYSRLCLAKALGAKWVRMDFNWDQIEPAPGQWDFRATDHCVDDACELGLKIYGTLAYSPQWATQGPAHTGVPDPEAWKEFIRVLTTRYRGEIGAYGIWNEPNLEEFWSGTSGDYVKVLLLPAAQIIHQQDPGAKVAGPDLAHLYSARLGIDAFYQTFVEEGGAEAVDILSHHVYGADDFPQKILGFRFARVLYKPGLKQILEKHGLEKKELWITEMGMEAKAAGEAEQGKRIVQELNFLKEQGWIKKAFVYELANNDSSEEQWGIIRGDGSLRPAYQNLQLFLAGLNP